MHTERTSQHRPLLDVRGVCKTFVSKGLFASSERVVAATDGSFDIDRGDVCDASDPVPRQVDDRRVRCHLSPENASMERAD